MPTCAAGAIAAPALEPTHQNYPQTELGQTQLSFSLSLSLSQHYVAHESAHGTAVRCAVWLEGPPDTANRSKPTVAWMPRPLLWLQNTPTLVTVTVVVSRSAAATATGNLGTTSASWRRWGLLWLRGTAWSYDKSGYSGVPTVGGTPYRRTGAQP